MQGLGFNALEVGRVLGAGCQSVRARAFEFRFYAQGSSFSLRSGFYIHSMCWCVGLAPTAENSTKKLLLIAQVRPY